MADNNDTGTGGINLNGDLYTFDVVESNSPDDSSGGKQGAWSPGQVTVDKTIKDVSKPTRETFAKYLSKTTLGKAGTSVDLPVRPNPYPVGAGDGTALQEIRLKDQYGNPAQPGISPNESKFAPEFNQTVGAPAPLPLKKGYTVNPSPDENRPVEQDGNSLLRNAAAQADPDPVNYVRPAKGLSDPLKTYVSSVLKNNRFNPIVDNKSFIPDYLSSLSLKAATTEQYYANASFARPDQLRLGSSAGNDDATKREYGFKRLARVAPILQQNATFLNRFNTSNQNPENANSSAQAGNQDSGADFTLPIERINVESIIRDLSTDIVKPEEITDFGSKFETTLNSLVDRFTSLSTESQVAVAAALISAVFKTYEVIDGQIGNANLPAGVTKRYGKGGGRQGIGTYFGGPTEPTSILDFIKVMSNQNMAAKKLQFLNVRPTSRPFREAVMRGMQSFFNLSADSNAQYSKILRPTKNTNYTIVLARSIIRAATRMALELKEINDAPNLNSNEKAYEGVKVIRDSRLIGIFNFFAQVGDVGLDASPDAAPLYDVTLLDLDSGRKISLIDSFSDAYEPNKGNSSAKHGKSRLFQGKVRKLAWALNQTPDYLLGPSPSDSSLRSTFGTSSGMISKDPTSRMRMEVLPELTPRLPVEVRSGIETLYESEYVPFYFHDVRTNEILGFHAFILSLSEDYTANYESIDGYGRVEPIKIYKSTQRKISLSFIAAALDSNDFDTLWYKINKLTTLVYPQFTPGKKLSDASGQFQFTKPFTQTIGASPLVRIRLGNLFRSNYSKYNLSKIFGLDDPEAVIMGQDKTGQRAGDLRKQKLIDAKQNFADATARSAEVEKQLQLVATDVYNNQYKYKSSNDDVEPSVIPISPAANNEDTASKKNLANQSEFRIAKEDNKNTNVPFLRNAWNTYKLVCRVEAVATSIEEADLEKGQERFSFAPVDPTKHYDPNTVFKVSYEKITLDEYLIELGSSPAPDIDLKNFEEINKKNKALAEELNAAHAAYDRAVLKNEAPDITKYKFLNLQSFLNPDTNMIQASKDQQAKSAEKLTDDKEAARVAAQQAADQQARVADEEEKKALAEGGSDPKAAAEKEFLSNAETFMNSDNNSIVRSFRSTGGRGLAGFIESMGFDWMAGTWDTSDGRKAPKMCKITISFSPIHDITPGLDSNGQNRAPIYPIGPYSNNGQ